MFFLIIMQKSKVIDSLVWNKDQNHYYYNTFLKKCSKQLPKNNDNQYIFK